MKAFSSLVPINGLYADKLYVCYTDNLHLTRSSNTSHKTGGKGQSPGQLDQPWDTQLLHAVCDR